MFNFQFASALDPIYLDHHATTPCDPRVVEAMLPFFTEVFGNPASVTHLQGRRAAAALEEARAVIARFFAVQAGEIYFTAGATESNNLALGLVKPGDHLVTSAIEHKSILVPARRLEARGATLTVLAVDREGFVDPEDLRKAIRPETRLVSIEAANGEIGTLQTLDSLGAICRERGVLFHSDVTQAAGKVDLDFVHLDLASFSGHKLYGPKGIGGLFVRRGIRVEPIMAGGGQEKNLRSGTVNVPGAVGMATAFALRAEEMADEAIRLTALRDVLWDRIVTGIDFVSVHGPRTLRLPGNLNVSFDRVEAESLIHAMRHFSLSSGSACSSGERGASPVLTAIGVSEKTAMGSIRIGLGKSNTGEQIEMLVDDLGRSVGRLREISSE